VEMLANCMQNPNNLRTLIVNNSNFNGELVKNFFTQLVKDKVVNPNFHIEILDLSKNKFGYSGIEAISNFLIVNTSLKLLNLFNNFFDVDGARSLGKALAVNKTLEFLDIGYNRIKDLGFIEISNAIISNPASSLRFLGSRYNLIKNKMGVFVNNLEKMLKTKVLKLEQMEISNNPIDEKTINYIHSVIYPSSCHQVNIDIFEILHYLSQERLERTVWISPLTYGTLKKTIVDCLKQSEDSSFLDDNSYLGIPLAIRIFRPKKLGEKKENNTCDAFVEFIHPNSANRMLKIAATYGFNVGGKKMRVYKAGTRPERLMIRKKKK